MYLFEFKSILGDFEGETRGRQFPVNPNEGHSSDFVQREGECDGFFELSVEAFLAEKAVAVVVDLKRGVGGTIGNGEQLAAEFVDGLFGFELFFQFEIALRATVEERPLVLDAEVEVVDFVLG